MHESEEECDENKVPSTPVINPTTALARLAQLAFFLALFLFVCWALNQIYRARTEAKPSDPGSATWTPPQSVTWTHLAHLCVACQDYKQRRGSWPPTIA